MPWYFCIILYSMWNTNSIFNDLFYISLGVLNYFSHFKHFSTLGFPYCTRCVLANLQFSL